MVRFIERSVSSSHTRKRQKKEAVTTSLCPTLNRTMSLGTSSLDPHLISHERPRPRELFKSIVAAGERAITGEALNYVGLWHIGLGAFGSGLGLLYSLAHTR